MTVVTFGIVGQGSASLSTLNGFHLRLLVLRIRPSFRDLYVQYDMSDATVEQQTFTDLMNIHRHYTHRNQEDNDKAIKILLDKINDPEKINWHPRFYKTLAECDIVLPLVHLVDFRYVLMNTFPGAHRSEERRVGKECRP